MKKVLIPIDYSTISGYAADFALMISEKRKIELVFYHMNDQPIPKDNDPKKEANEKLKQERKQMEKLMGFINKRIAKNKMDDVGKRLKFIIENGVSAANSILAIAKKEKVDLVIMGTKGATGLKKIFMGSVASHLVQKSKVPVFVVPVRPKFKTKVNIIYSTDLLHAKSEIARLKPLQKVLSGTLEALYVNYGWAFTKEEQKQYDLLKKSSVVLHEKKVSLKNPLGFHLQAFMKGRPNAVLAVFHENKSFFEKLLFRNRPESFAMEMKVPIVSFQKK